MRPLIFVAAAAVATYGNADTLRSLAERKDLTIGVMALDATWHTPLQKELVSSEFNAVTVGTYWKRVRPSRDMFDWSVTDAAVNWARSEELAVHLHPLLYPADNQNPAWVLQSDPAHARDLLEEHIAAAMDRYRGVVDVWDVVNEAVAPTAAGGLRDNWWLRSMGPGYVVEAFRIARAHDPTATLIYNDHDIELGNSYQTGKWNTVKDILTSLHAEGLVDGLGWQLHTNPDEVLGSQFRLAERMEWVESLGLANFVTELDVEISAGDAELVRQGEAYERITETWLDHHAGGWLQTWGVYDRYTWLGSDKRPLLFDENYAPKPAYFGVRSALEAETYADFNADGAIDGADLLYWQQIVGEGGIYDSSDLMSWSRQIAANASPPGAAAASFRTPEPSSTTMLLAAGLAGYAVLRSRRIKSRSPA